MSQNFKIFRKTFYWITRARTPTGFRVIIDFKEVSEEDNQSNESFFCFRLGRYSSQLLSQTLTIIGFRWHGRELNELLFSHTAALTRQLDSMSSKSNLAKESPGFARALEIPQ